jgi:methylthioribose-1-phosphate isomerase
LIVNGRSYQSIWLDGEDDRMVRFINQLLLPFEFRVDALRSSGDVLNAIREMKVRGAPLIGAAAALGVYLACLEAKNNKNARGDPFAFVHRKALEIKNSRPTAVNLGSSVNRVLKVLEGRPPDDMIRHAREEALNILDEEKKSSLRIGQHGVPLINEIYQQKKPGYVNILTHCNAGWLACIDYGTATSPIYMAHDMGLPVHVWVDETRPRNQGARLTSWELGQHGVPHTVISDNAGGYLMQTGKVDMVLVGSDRTTRTGDVANKIGTYLKALAAHDNGIPFYVALPSSSIDFTMSDGLKEIPVEERDAEEMHFIEGMHQGELRKIRIMPEGSPVSNFGFDITPARFVTGLITEKGVCGASEKDLSVFFPDRY